MHIFKHSLFRLKITVGCLTSTYPSIHFSLDEDTLEITVGCLKCISKRSQKNSQDHGRLPAVHIQAFTFLLALELSRSRSVASSAYPSVHKKNLHSCWTPWAKRETRGLWARPPVLSPVPSQAVHSRACLNSHHSDIQGTAQKSPCVNTI